MTLRELEVAVVEALEDIKAQDIQVLKTHHLSDLFERVIIATGNSNRQTRSLAKHVSDKARALGVEQVRVEGEETGDWVLIDLGDIVVHVMVPQARDYYALESLWGGEPINRQTPFPLSSQLHTLLI